MLAPNRILVYFFQLFMISDLMALISGANIPYLYSKQCNYLNITETQSYNAYKGPGRLCCLCAAGTKFVDNCNSTDPSSTICEACGPNTYREYSGHNNKDCEFDAGTVCFPPFISIPGTATKRSSCGCPEGEIKDGNSCIKDETVPIVPPTTKMPVPPSPSPPTTLQVSTATSGTLTQYIDKPKLTPQTEIPAIDDVEVKTDTSKEGKTERPDREPDSIQEKEKSVDNEGKGESNVEEDAEYTWIIPLAILCVVMLLVMVGIHYHKRRKQTASSAKGSVESSSQSSPCSSRTALMSTSRQDQISGRVVETPPSENEAEPMRETNQRMCQPDRLRNVEADIAESLTNDAGRMNRTIDHNYSIKFISSYAEAIGKAFGDKFGQKDISPFYRHIGVTNVDLDDLKNDKKGDTRELIYQLTLNAYRKKGVDFTRDFLVERVESMEQPLQHLIPIIEDEWAKCRDSHMDGEAANILVHQPV